MSTLTGEEKIVLTYTKSDNTAGMEAVPVTYFTQGSGINTTYMSDYIKYVNIFNNLTDFRGTDKLISEYLSKLNVDHSLAPCYVDNMFKFSNAYFYYQPNSTYVGITLSLFDRMFWTAKSGNYIDMSGTLLHINNYDEYIKNKNTIDNTYIAVIRTMYGISCGYKDGSITPNIIQDNSTFIQLAISKLSDVFGNPNEPITLYNTGYFLNINYASDENVTLSLCSYEPPETAYKLIDYRCRSVFSHHG